MKQLNLTHTRLGRDDFKAWINEDKRRRSAELDFGAQWALDTETTWADAPQWRLSWIDDTGELYAATSGQVDWRDIGDGQPHTCYLPDEPTGEHGIGIVFDETFNDREEVERFLHGWADEPVALGALINNHARLELNNQRQLQAKPPANKRTKQITRTQLKRLTQLLLRLEAWQNSLPTDLERQIATDIEHAKQTLITVQNELESKLNEGS